MRWVLESRISVFECPEAGRFAPGAAEGEFINRNSKIEIRKRLRSLVVAVVAGLGAVFAELAEQAGLRARAVTVALEFLLSLG
ncbi:hypothetical protein MASR2M8_11620 [Opitutaceae bacterium]